MSSAQLRIYTKKIKNAVFQGQKRAAKELIQILIDVIRTRVRVLHELASGSKIPRLAKSTIKYRERYSDNLDSETSPETSNATATGQMLDSLSGKAIGTRIIISTTGSRSGELSGGKSRLTNDEVNAFYEKKMGEWLALQDEERQSSIDYAADIIKEQIKIVSK